MDLLSFISDSERKRRLAVLTGASEGYLWQCATGWRGKRTSPELAQSIERASLTIGAEVGVEGVLRCDLRPDIWPPGEAA